MNGNKGLGKCPICWKTIEPMTPTDNVMLGRPAKAHMVHRPCKEKHDAAAEG